jgi:hypothetical protein
MVQKSYKTFSNNFGKGFENGMIEGGENGSRKKILKLKFFSPLKILTSPIYLQRLLELSFFLPLFSILFLSLFFNAPSLWGLGDFDDFLTRKTLFKNFFSDEMEWNG